MFSHLPTCALASRPVARTVPSERRPTVWVSPQATAMRFVQPLRSHCPNWLLPAASAVPSARTATVKSFPQATPTTSDQELTSHWPKSLFPVARTLPSARKATVCSCPAGDAALLGLGPGDGDGPLQRNAAQVTESCLVPQDSAAGRADFFYFGPAPIAEPRPRAQVHAAGSTLYHKSYPNFAVRDQMAAAIRSPIWAVPTWVPCPAYRSGVR